MTLSWAGSAFLGAVHAAAREHEIKEGFEYARAGQARGVVFEPGRVSAQVQGRALRPYKVILQVQTFDDAQWERVLARTAEHAIEGGRILAGEADDSLVALFAGVGLTLFPSGPTEVLAACTAPGERPWCKHACCVALLVAEALEKDPLLILTLRGMPAAEFVDRLRDRRSAATAAAGLPARSGDLPASLREPSPPLESVVEEFWESGPGLDELETPIKPPDVSHPLLRRLGPSPFPDGRFPLVGLLATCYDVMSKAAIEDPGAPPKESRP
jgi:uncharacterized Zn finger protein